MNQTINISLPKTLSNLAKQQVKKGYYSSFSEVVRDALRQFLAPQKPIILSGKAAKRYDKMIDDIELEKEKAFIANNVDELMEHLENL